MAGTKYVILRAIDAPDSHAGALVEVGITEASNGEAAVNAFLGEEKNAEEYGEGDYRAVPKQSWPDKPYSKRRKVSFV